MKPFFRHVFTMFLTIHHLTLQGEERASALQMALAFESKLNAWKATASAASERSGVSLDLQLTQQLQVRDTRSEAHLPSFMPIGIPDLRSAYVES